MNKDIDLAARLVDLRKSAHLSQDQVAKYLGIDQSMLSKMESGERSIGVSVLEDLASLYCLSAYDLANSGDITEKMKLAFRAKELTSEDLINLARVNKIIINQRFMDNLAEK